MDGQKCNALLQSELKSVVRPKQRTELSAPPSLIPPGCAAITPAMLPLIDLEPEHIEQVVQAVPSGAHNVQDIYPLTPLQEGLLFHHIMAGESDAYVTLALLEMRSRAHLDVFINALQQVIDRHDILRSAFLWRDLPRPVQVVQRQAVLPVEELELDSLRDPIEQLQEWMRPELQSLKLHQAPLVRLQIAPNREGSQWYALLKIHHLVCDGQSIGVVIAEVMEHIAGRSQELPAAMQYRTHVAQALAYTRTRDAEAFFRKKLGQITEPTAP